MTAGELVVRVCEHQSGPVLFYHTKHDARNNERQPHGVKSDVEGIAPCGTYDDVKRACERWLLLNDTSSRGRKAGETRSYWDRYYKREGNKALNNSDTKNE